MRDRGRGSHCLCLTDIVMSMRNSSMHLKALISLLCSLHYHGEIFKVWPSLSILSPFVGSLFPILFEGQSVTCLECISAAISSTLPCLACGVCACKVYVALFFSQSALLSRGTRTHEIARLSVFRRINIELNLLNQNMRLYGPRKKCSPINPVPTPPL